MHRAGFCWGCRTFWGGIESFEFMNPQGLCDNCIYDPELAGGFANDDLLEYDDYDGPEDA